MNGNMNQSYIRSSSIHLSFNRAVNIHATHFVTIENNVIYNIMSVFTLHVDDTTVNIFVLVLL